MSSTGAQPARLARPVAAVAQHDILPTLFGEGYGIYETKPATFLYSLLLHLVVGGSLVWASYVVVQNKDQIKQQVTSLIDPGAYLPLPIKPDMTGGGGGGGDRDKLAASQGKPPKLDMEQITPPTAVIRNEAPKLVAEQSIVVPPELNLATSAINIGDPLSKVLSPPSNGTGSGSGIGTGSGGGIGSGTGAGLGPGTGGGYGGGTFRIGGGVSAPRPLYMPDPEFSEEARKAKHQGTVVLWVVVGADGRVHDMKVQRSLGLGLDQKALEAVKQWKFEPARKDGRPVAVQLNVEVSFRLY